MKKQGDASVIALAEAAGAGEEARVELRGGRELAVEQGRFVELRAPGGAVELRIEITDEGPVLRAEGVRLALAADTLSLQASESLEIASEGRLSVRSREALEVESTDDELRLRGEKIHLN